MCIAATWPSPTLATGFATLSKSLYESLARPETDATVSIHIASFGKFILPHSSPRMSHAVALCLVKASYQFLKAPLLICREGQGW